MSGHKSLTEFIYVITHPTWSNEPLYMFPSAHVATSWLYIWSSFCRTSLINRDTWVHPRKGQWNFHPIIAAYDRHATHNTYNKHSSLCWYLKSINVYISFVSLLNHYYKFASDEAMKMIIEHDAAIFVTYMMPCLPKLGKQ